MSFLKFACDIEMTVAEKIACEEPIDFSYGEDLEVIPQDDINTVVEDV